MASKRRKKVIDNLERFIEQTMRRLQLRAYQALTVASPVRTGFFRSGWSATAGVPDRTSPTRPAADFVKGLSNAEKFNLTRAQAEALFGKHTKSATQLASSYKLANGVIFIVNNVHYGVILNTGTSAQAPAMFVEMAIAEAVRATVREVKQ